MLTSTCSWCYSALAFVLCVTVYADQTLTASEDVDPKRPWEVIRLGRGLNMLRLGKRNGEDPKDNPTFSLSDEEVRQLLDLLLGESRDQQRRQPPLPRYGRDNASLRRDLLELLASLPNRQYMRPPPRGGRYKRSANHHMSSQFSDSGLPYHHIRSVVKPRIGRYIPEVSRQTKAVSRPRIGRDRLFQSSSQQDAVDGILGVYQ